MNDVFGVDQLIAAICKRLSVFDNRRQNAGLALGELHCVKGDGEQIASGLMGWLAIPDCLGVCCPRRRDQGTV